MGAGHSRITRRAEIRSAGMRYFRCKHLFPALLVLLASGAMAAPPPTADDIIARILRQSNNLPAAPAGPKPAEGAGPSVGAKPSGPLPMVMSARIGEHEDRTRLVIELSDPVNMRTFTLANPDRVVIDMPQVAWRLGAPPRPSGNGAIKSYRYGLFRAGNSRIVIDLNQPVSVSDALVIPPSSGFGYRVVIDLFPTDPAKFTAAAGWPADLKARETDAARLAALIAAPASARSRAGAGGRIIVIDPGHGGLDSGHQWRQRPGGKGSGAGRGSQAGEGSQIARLYRSHDPGQ